MSGTVMDRSGAVVADAKIEVTNSDTNIRTATTTNKSGIYVVNGLRPGRYRMAVGKEGFRSIVVTDITLNVQDVVSRNFNLDVGAFSESITVTADALNVNTTDGSVSTVINRQFVESLPLNGRSFNTLLQLTPGVVIAAGSNIQTPGQFSIAGQRTDSNNFNVDGVSANFGVAASTGPAQSGTGTAQAFNAIGGTSSLVSVDALQEFRIETSSFSPEFGRAPGGQVILTTRSGTNGFHGGGFDYFRNTVLDANNWFANQQGEPRAPEHHNDFGGFLGGPIWKDRTFFFMSYEGARLDVPQTTVVTVPSAYSRSIAPAAVAPYVNAYPQPDNSAIVPGVYTSNFTGNYANRATLDAGSIRVDHKFDDRFSVFARYNDAPSQTLDRADSLSELRSTEVNTRTFTVGANMLLSAMIANTLRANYSSQAAGFLYSMDSFGGATPFDASLMLGPLSPSQNAASFSPEDIEGFNIGNEANNRTRQVNFVDDLSVTVGTHQLKFGGDYRAVFLNARAAHYGIAPFVVSIQNFVSAGTAGQLDFLITGVQNPERILTQAFSLYAQDTWKASRRLTVTYGLRWELAPAPSTLGSTTLASWTNTNDPAKVALGPSGAPLWGTTYRNFAPRFGLAYSFNDKDDLVLRVGGGIFYDTGVGSSAQLGSEFPNSNLNFVSPLSVPIGDPTVFLPGPASSTPPYPDPVFAIADDLKLPRSYQWNAALEKSFGNHQSISVTYVGQAGRNLLRQEAINLPNPNFQGNLLLTVNDAYSNYHALQLQYRKPLSTGLQALINYTWSHSLDNSSNDFLVGLSSTVISAASDYASSDFDVRHSFSAGLTYAIPSVGRRGPLALLSRDWSLSTVIVARTGFPFNEKIAAPSVLGVQSRRPDLVSGQPIYLYGSQCSVVFQGMNVLAPGQSCPGGKGLNPSAFSVPPTIRQGTEGRNDIPGFGLTQVDFSLGKAFSIGERVKLQFRTDAFNLFNHPNFTNPPGTTLVPRGLLSRSTLNQSLGGLNALFQEGGPRSLQLSLKLLF
jgi:hypothetical protein